MARATVDFIIRFKEGLCSNDSVLEGCKLELERFGRKKEKSKIGKEFNNFECFSKKKHKHAKTN